MNQIQAPGSCLNSKVYGLEHSNGGLITFPGGVPLLDAEGLFIGSIGVRRALIYRMDSEAPRRTIIKTVTHSQFYPLVAFSSKCWHLDMCRCLVDQWKKTNRCKQTTILMLAMIKKQSNLILTILLICYPIAIVWSNTQGGEGSCSSTCRGIGRLVSFAPVHSDKATDINTAEFMRHV